MSFQDQVTADLPTFTNVDEFGSARVIDGATVACVLVNDEEPSDFEGVSVLASTLYARAADLLPTPEVRNRMVIDGQQANVMRVDEEQGMLVVRLSWFNS